jgi:hypothetical protein
MRALFYKIVSSLVVERAQSSDGDCLSSVLGSLIGMMLLMLLPDEGATLQADAHHAQFTSFPWCVSTDQGGASV